MVVKVILVVLVVHQSILKNKEKNIEIYFTYKDDDFDYGHMETTHLDIVFFFC